MLKINECYADSSVKPQVEVSDNAFKIVLPNRNASSAAPVQPQTTQEPFIPSAQKRLEIVLSLFDTRSTITRKDIQTALNISQSSAVLLVRALVADKLLIKEGDGKQTRYRKG